MRIECPGCETAYEVPDSQIRPGRSVRCACCDRQWLPAPDPVEAIDAPAEAMPDTQAALIIPELPPIGSGRVQLRQSAAPKPTGEGVGPIIARVGLRLGVPAWVMPRLRTWTGVVTQPWGLGWVASLVLLVGLLVAAGHWRTAIMHGWPPSIRLFTALGARPPRS